MFMRLSSHCSLTPDFATKIGKSAPFCEKKKTDLGQKSLALQLPCRINITFSISTDFGVAYWPVCKGCVSAQSM